MSDADLHRALLHRERFRECTNTPVLVLDRDALDRNIRAMAAFATAKGIALRPHAKTHKSADIVRLQLAAGARGVCCAKLGEAEALAAHGIGDILITSPVVSAPAIARLVSLRASCSRLRLVVDNPANVAELSAALGDLELDVLVDIDPGIRRTGVTSGDAALKLARTIADTRNLVYRGVQFYCGAQQHVATFAERQAALRDRTQYLQSIVSLLDKHDARPEIVSGGGTGSHCIDAELRVINELQAGSYIFMDRQYANCDLTGQGWQPFEYALFVEARVVSANHRGIATIDVGFKTLSTDGGVPAILSGAPVGASFHFMGDEHAAIVDPGASHEWQIGDLVRLAVSHCDPTVNLYDAYHVVSGDTLIDIWRVTARGRSR